MILTIQFNDEPEITYDVTDLHVSFERNILTLDIQKNVLTKIERVLTDLDFPNQTLNLFVRLQDG